jgi:hypothetical protein
MLTDQKNRDGLGVFLQGDSTTLRFGHNGRDEGFDALLTASVDKGQGIVIMINANDNSRMVNQIVNAVAAHYQWKGFPVRKPIKRVAAKVNNAQLAAFEGRYEFANNRMITFQAKNNRLFSLSDGFPDEEFVPLTATQLASTDRDASITFEPDAKGQVTELAWEDGNEERKIPRIGPLFTGAKTISDPDPGRTQQISAALKAMFTGGKAVQETPFIAAGTRRAFVQGSRDIGNIQSISLVHSENVNGRGIQRHDSDISKIVTYQLNAGKPYRYILVHLTADGLVADCDVVD